MQSMVGVQFSRPPSPNSRCISIGSCQSYAPAGRRNPKLGYPSLHFLVYPKFTAFRKLTKFVPLTTNASHSEYATGEELVSLKVSIPCHETLSLMFKRSAFDEIEMCFSLS